MTMTTTATTEPTTATATTTTPPPNRCGHTMHVLHCDDCDGRMDYYRRAEADYHRAQQPQPRPQTHDDAIFQVLADRALPPR